MVTHCCSYTLSTASGILGERGGDAVPWCREGLHGVVVLRAWLLSGPDRMSAAARCSGPVAAVAEFGHPARLISSLYRGRLHVCYPTTGRRAQDMHPIFGSMGSPMGQSDGDTEPEVASWENVYLGVFQWRFCAADTLFPYGPPMLQSSQPAHYD
jgi:hypothetical protein